MLSGPIFKNVHYSCLFNLEFIMFCLDGTTATSNLGLSLPPLPSSELTDPNDDVTLPRLIEALQNRQRIRQLMTDEYNKAGACSRFLLRLFIPLLIMAHPFHFFFPPHTLI